VIFPHVALAIACAFSQPALTTVGVLLAGRHRSQSICNRVTGIVPSLTAQTVCHTDSSLIETSPCRCPSNIGVLELTLKRQLRAVGRISFRRLFAIQTEDNLLPTSLLSVKSQ
jgi:hypothetical protein